MGLLDELKKLTKPYDDEDYLEEDLADPVRVPVQDNRSYASYAEAPRPAEPAQSARRGGAAPPAPRGPRRFCSSRRRCSPPAARPAPCRGQRPAGRSRP